jgi:hypothetical protein
MPETQSRGARGRSSRGQQPQQATRHAPEPTPGLDAVRAIGAQPTANPAAIVRLMRQYPMERDEILTWLHQNRGNAFVQRVTAQLGQIERHLPEGVDVQSVSGSFTLPAGVELTGNWQATVATRNPTTVGVEVTQTGINVWCQPGIFVDATWPLQNAFIRSAGMQFGGRPHANVDDQGALGAGFISISNRVEGKITDMIAHAIAGTPFARPGYVPNQDADLGGTLQRVMTGFRNLFQAGDHQGGGGGGVNARRMSDVSAGATVTTAGGDYTRDGTGLQVAAGSPISLHAQGAANIQQLIDAGSPQSAISAANVQAITVESGGLTVVAGGKPVARIERLTVHRGGRVTIDSLELLGSARRAQAAEAGLSLIVSLLAQRAGNGQVMVGAMENANRPQVVGGLSRAMLEREFTSTVQEMVMQYRRAVPGIDLAQVLGVG